MKKPILFFAVCSTLFFTNCQSDEDIKPGTSFTIDFEFQQKVTNDLTVSFIEITTDSRCPCEAACITAGQIGVKIKMETNETELTKLFTLEKYDELEGAVIETEFDGYKIELLDVLPFPCNGEPSKNEDYSVEILVTE